MKEKQKSKNLGMEDHGLRVCENLYFHESVVCGQQLTF